MSTSATSPPGSSTRVPPPTRSGRSRGWGKQLLLRLHFYIGIFIGPFLLVAALSGALYTLSPQLERALYAQALTGTVVDQPLTLGEQIAAAQAASGLEETPAAVRPAETGGTTRIMFTDPSLGEHEHRAVFVDPGTGEVTADMAVYGASGALPLRATISQLHRSLLLGEPGRLYSELAASWLWVLTLSGTALWAARWRRARPGRRIRGLLTPATTANVYRRTLSWHAVTGIWLAIGFLFLSATGLSWSTLAGANVGELRAHLGWSTPTLTTDLEPSEATDEAGDQHKDHGTTAQTAPHTEAASIDQVLAIARDTGIDASKVEIEPSTEPGTAWTVTEIDHSWPTQVDAVAVDPATGQVTDHLRFDDYSLSAKLTRWGIDAHTGELFGLANQIVLAIIALGLTAVVAWGYLMWWHRRPTRATGLTFGAAPARGALRRAPLGAAAAVALAALGLGVYQPMLGISLAAFLLLDLLLGARRSPTGDRVS